MRATTVARFGLAVVALLAYGVCAPAPASAATYPVDVQAECNSEYPNQGTSAVAVNRTDAFSWRCVRGTVSYGVNMQRACNLQRGGSYFAALASRSDPYSWSCAVPPCRGSGCNHLNPGGSGCDGANASDVAQVEVPGRGATVMLRYSAFCGANWTRWVGGVSAPGTWNWWVQNTVRRENPIFPNALWTFMVDGTGPARACVQGNADPNPGCTAWY